MIGYKVKRDRNSAILHLSLLWVFALSLQWYIHKGDHAEITLSFGPIDIKFGTSIWWNKVVQ